jgi:hypothetical protein
MNDSMAPARQAQFARRQAQFLRGRLRKSEWLSRARKGNRLARHVQARALMDRVP